jgi:hypothetical protein
MGERREIYFRGRRNIAFWSWKKQWLERRATVLMVVNCLILKKISPLKVLLQ